MHWTFEAVDVARARLLAELADELGFDDEAVETVIDLVDQVHTLRRQLHQLGLAIGRQPAETREAIAVALKTARALVGSASAEVRAPDYSGSTPARFTASPQAAQPVFMISVISAGVVPVANRPMSRSFSLPSGVCTSLRISALTRSTISLGVPAGAMMPFQPTRLIL